MKKPKIKSIAYGEFNDNEYLEAMVRELNAQGGNVVLGCLDEVVNWGRSNSLWPLTFATSCCGIEYMAVGAARYDFARFGFEVTRASPRQADFIMVAGTITDRMAPVLKRLYDQMADPKYVIAIGACAVSGGPFRKSYHVVNGVDEILPVDVYVPGCPPRPEAMLYGIIQLQRKVRVEKFFGGVNRSVEDGRFNDSMIQKFNDSGASDNDSMIQKFNDSSASDSDSMIQKFNDSGASDNDSTVQKFNDAPKTKADE